MNLVLDKGPVLQSNLVPRPVPLRLRALHYPAPQGLQVPRLLVMRLRTLRCLGYMEAFLAAAGNAHVTEVLAVAAAPLAAAAQRQRLQVSRLHVVQLRVLRRLMLRQRVLYGPPTILWPAEYSVI